MYLNASKFFLSDEEYNTRVNKGLSVVGYYKKGTADEQAAKSVREQRDRLLSETDWVVIKSKETETTLSTSFKTYRQALRDITLQDGFPHNIVWPENI